MSQAADLPLWAALLVAAFLLLGAFLTLVGSYGLYRLQSFYDRIHAPTLGTSWGAAGIMLASMIFFTVLQSRPVVHEILIGVFVIITTPVTLMLLGRAALHRDRVEGNSGVPLNDPPKGVLEAPESADVAEPMKGDAGKGE